MMSALPTVTSASSAAAGRRSPTPSPATRSAVRRGRRCSPASTPTTTAPRATTRSAAAAIARCSSRTARWRRWLQADGYQTGFVGKWLNGLRTPRRAPPGWNEWDGLVGEGGEGLSSFYDYDVFEPDGTPRHFGDRPADYQTDALTREYALPFIDAQALAPRPFFLWLAYHPPHNGVGRNDPAGHRCSEGPPASRRASRARSRRRATRAATHRARVPRPPSFDERDVSDKPKFVRRRPRLSRDDLTRITATTAAGWRRCGRSTTACADRRPPGGHRPALEHGARVPHRPGRDGGRAPDQARQEPPLRGGDQGPAADARARDRRRPNDRRARVQRRPRADDPPARRRDDPARARAPDRRPVAGRLARQRAGRTRVASCRSRAGATSPARAVASRSGPTSACARPATRTSSTAARASTRREGIDARSAPGGRPSASSTTCAGPLRTAQPRPRSGLRGDPQPARRSDRARSSAAPARSASSRPASPARGPAGVSVSATDMAGKGRARWAAAAALALLLAAGALFAGGGPTRRPRCASRTSS